MTTPQADLRLSEAGTDERVYAIVARIPPGRVATYGQIAAIEGRCTPRRVGQALARLPASRSDIPWQRVLNAAGRISERSEGEGAVSQRSLLTAEGVLFDRRGRVDFEHAGWPGPELGWLLEHGLFPAPPAGTRALGARGR